LPQPLCHHSVISDARRYDRLGLTDRDFIRRDVSRDGYLSRQEAGTDPVLLKGFSRFDINRDGRLSETEYRNAETALERERIAVNADDASLNTAVGKALAAIKGLKTEDVKIEISAGALVLSGVVAHPGLAIEAHDAVKRCSGTEKHPEPTDHRRPDGLGLTGYSIVFRDRQFKIKRRALTFDGLA